MRSSLPPHKVLRQLETWESLSVRVNQTANPAHPRIITFHAELTREVAGRMALGATGTLRPDGDGTAVALSVYRSRDRVLSLGAVWLALVAGVVGALAADRSGYALLLAQFIMTILFLEKRHAAEVCEWLTAVIAEAARPADERRRRLAPDDLTFASKRRIGWPRWRTSPDGRTRYLGPLHVTLVVTGKARGANDVALE